MAQKKRGDPGSRATQKPIVAAETPDGGHHQCAAQARSASVRRRTRGKTGNPAGFDAHHVAVASKSAESQNADHNHNDLQPGDVGDSGFPALISACRARRQYQQAELRLGNQLKAIIRGVNNGSQGPADNHWIPAPETKEIGDQANMDAQSLTESGFSGHIEELDGHADVDNPVAFAVEATDIVDPDSDENQQHDVGDASVALLVVHFKEFMRPFRLEKRRCEKEIQQIVQSWPIIGWLKDPARRGFGVVGLGLVLGETGDLSQYANPAKVWKRMGLAVLDGKAQRRVAGTTKAKKVEAVSHGFSPRRRSLMHVIGDCLVKGNQDGPYRSLYLERKAYELERLPEEAKPRLLISHKRALRYMEKRLLKDLWLAWRRVTNDVLHTRGSMSSAAPAQKTA